MLFEPTGLSYAHSITNGRRENSFPNPLKHVRYNGFSLRILKSARHIIRTKAKILLSGKRVNDPADMGRPTWPHVGRRA